MSEDNILSIDPEFEKLLSEVCQYNSSVKKCDQILVNLDTGHIAKSTISGVVTVGRNDPCPCGSGKKFKKCCINS